MIAAIVPALNEAANIGDVVVGASAHVDVVVVVDNGSADGTPERARAEGADVVSEPRRGYGRACLAGLKRAEELGATFVLFLDGDGSDDPGDLPAVIRPVLDGEADLVLGARARDRIEPGAMTRVQRFGNRLAPLLMRAFVGARYTDMPPMKACRLAALRPLHLSDVGHGFTIELLLAAHRAKLRVLEVPVGCRARRGGVSKVSGTAVGASRAAVKILWTIARHAARRS